MNKLVFFVTFALVFKCFELKLSENVIEEYIKTVSTYYRERNARVLTHFSCFSQRENVRISMALSAENAQSRFITKFDDKHQFIDTPNNTIQGFIVNLQCDGFENIFENEEHPKIFRDRNLWLLIDFSIETNVDEIIDQYKLKFNQLNAQPISDVFIAKRVQRDLIQWLFFDMYKVDSIFDIEVFPNGFIGLDKNGSFALVGTNVLAYRRKNLQGLTLPCGLVIAYPERYTYVDDPATNHIDVFSKAYMKFSENMREDLNMSCQVRQVDNYGWYKNGTFNGVMGLFQRKEIRMVFHGINMRPERLLFTEFAGNFFTPRTPLIFRQPPLTSVANIYILPLGLDVWISMLILLIVVIVVMFVQLSYPLLRTPMTLYDIVTFILGAFCQQGTHLELSNLSGRLIVLTTFLSSVALFTSYSANIVALLQSPSQYIHTLDDLIASQIKVGIHEAGYTHFYVKSNFSGITEIYKKKIEPQGTAGWIYDPFVGIEKVRTELFAFLLDSQSAYKAIHATYTDAEKCGIKEFQIIVLPISTIAVERNSGYKELVKQRITWQREVGLLQREEVRWIPKKPKCTGALEFITVGMKVVQPAVVLLLLGYILSIIILLVEWLYVAKLRSLFASLAERSHKSKYNISFRHNKKQT